MVVLIYLTFASKKTSQKAIKVGKDVELNGAIIAENDHVDENDGEEDSEDDEES